MTCAARLAGSSVSASVIAVRAWTTSPRPRAFSACWTSDGDLLRLLLRLVLFVAQRVELGLHFLLLLLVLHRHRVEPQLERALGRLAVALDRSFELTGRPELAAELAVVGVVLPVDSIDLHLGVRIDLRNRRRHGRLGGGGGGDEEPRKNRDEECPDVRHESDFEE